MFRFSQNEYINSHCTNQHRNLLRSNLKYITANLHISETESSYILKPRHYLQNQELTKLNIQNLGKSLQISEFIQEAQHTEAESKQNLKI